MSNDSKNLINLLMRVTFLSYKNGRHGCGRHYRHHHGRQKPGGMHDRMHKWMDAGSYGWGGMFGGFGGAGFGNGYSLSKGRVLTVLLEKGRMSQRELAEELDIKPSSVSELVGKLLKEGMITREQDEKDKRSYLISLAPEGRKKAEEMTSWFSERTNDIFSCLNEKEKNELESLLVKIIENNEGY